MDTIAAIATGSGIAGVGVIRLSGPRAIEIAEACVSAPLDRHVRVAWVRDRAGAAVDQVIAFAMRGPHSFTGEDVAELQGHGGHANLARLLAVVVERGARLAEPGEFTRRAFEHGKLDLIRAESLLEVIHAGSERGWRLAQANLSGRLGAEVAAIEARALKILAEIEGAIDFPDDELDAKSAAWIATELAWLQASCATLASGFRHGRAVVEGISVALVGAVNAGKSSLLNALVGTERAIVDPSPGTTRDYLEVHDTWDGVAVTLIDTAGTRATTDAIELRGMALASARVASADVVVVVSEDGGDAGTQYGERAVPVRSKADLAESRARLDATSATTGQGHGALATSATTGHGTLATTGHGTLATSATTGHGTLATTGQGHGTLATSATTGQGLDELRRRVLATAGVADREGSEQAFVTTARQQALAAIAREAFTAAISVARPPEVVALEIRQATTALAQLRGIEVGDRVLDELFARFCIGK